MGARVPSSAAGAGFFSDGVLIVAPWVILYLFTETHRMQAARVSECAFPLYATFGPSENVGK